MAVVIVARTSLHMIEIKNGKFLILHHKVIAKITEDGTLLGKAKTIMDNIVDMDAVEFNQAMFTVDSMKDLIDILRWHKLLDFKRVQFSCFFIVNPNALRDTIVQNQSLFRNMKELVIMGPNQITKEIFLNISDAIMTPDVQILGNTIQR